MSAAAPADSGPSWDQLIAAAETELGEPIPPETFAAVVPEMPDDVPEEERRYILRESLGMLAPQWVVDLAIADPAILAGEDGNLLRDAVTLCVFTDRGPTLSRLAKHFLSRGVNRHLVLAVLHGWAAHFCAPCPEEEEILAAAADASADVEAGR